MAIVPRESLRKFAEEAPPLTPEQAAVIRAVFATAPSAKPKPKRRKAA